MSGKDFYFRLIWPLANLATDLIGVTMALQVVEVTLFTAENARKSIKGKVTISDGVSKMICMLPDKVYNMMEQATGGEVIRKFDVWMINAGK